MCSGYKTETDVRVYFLLALHGCHLLRFLGNVYTKKKQGTPLSELVCYSYLWLTCLSDMADTNIRSYVFLIIYRVSSGLYTRNLKGVSYQRVTLDYLNLLWLDASPPESG